MNTSILWKVNDMINLDDARKTALKWATEHPDVILKIGEDDMGDGSCCFDVNSATDEYVWSGFYLYPDGTTVEDSSEDMDDDERDWIEELASDLHTLLTEG